MKIHLDELELAREYAKGHEFEELSPNQIDRIRDKGREYFKWFKAHARLHAAISTAVIFFLLAGDWFVLIKLPHLVISPGHPGSVILAAILTGPTHSWLLYSIGVYSLHEGAAHNLIFPGRGPLSRAASFLTTNLCRVGASDPDYFASCHRPHHSAFATEKDSEFLNFVRPGRFWRTLLPFGPFINFSDFVVHRTLTYTPGRLISAGVGVIYNFTYAYFLYRFFGLTFALITLLLAPHFGFYLDRMRQYTEHNLMPLDNNSGSRSLGTGFWGLLIGGGPWGQPCHLEHHLVPVIPWYQQILLHRYLLRMLTERQRKQFLIQPVIGFPLLLWRVVRETGRFSSGRGKTFRAVAGRNAG